MKRALAILAVAALFIAAQKDDTNSLVGKPAPTFSLPTTDDKNVSLAEEKGNVVLIDFWATWCPPCRKSLPGLQKIHEDASLREKGLKVWAVNSGEEKDKAKGYCEQNKLTFTTPLDKENKVGTDYLVRGIPTTVVIGRDQKVKKVFVGFGPDSEEKIHAAVSAALEEPKPTASTN